MINEKVENNTAVLIKTANLLIQSFPQFYCTKGFNAKIHEVTDIREALIICALRAVHNSLSGTLHIKELDRQIGTVTYSTSKLNYGHEKW